VAADVAVVAPAWQLDYSVEVILLYWHMRRFAIVRHRQALHSHAIGSALEASVQYQHTEVSHSCLVMLLAQIPDLADEDLDARGGGQPHEDPQAQW